MRYQSIIKEAACLFALVLAFVVSLIFYFVIAVDVKPGTLSSRPVGWSLVAVIAAWLAVAGLTRWRKK